jgi:spore germination protein GerM
MTNRWITVVTFGVMIALLVSGCTPSASVPGEPSDQPSATMARILYFGNTEKNPGMMDCSLVFPVEREVPAVPDAAKAALQQLFAGPTEAEISEGYVSTFSADSQSILKGVKIEGDTAYVNLIDIRPTLTAVSSSCGSSAFFAEVENTLQAVAPVTRVIYAIEGDPGAFYEWVQLGCSPENDNCDPSPFADVVE